MKFCIDMLVCIFEIISKYKTNNELIKDLHELEVGIIKLITKNPNYNDLKTFILNYFGQTNEESFNKNYPELYKYFTKLFGSVLWVD